MITSWVRICKLLGSKFEPYLPMVMPQVLKTASMTVEMALLDRMSIANYLKCLIFLVFIEDEIKNYEDNNDWQCFSLSDQVIILVYLII